MSNRKNISENTNAVSKVTTYPKSALGRIWFDFALMTKFRLSSLVVFSAVMAYAIAVDQFSWTVFMILALGGFLVTAASNTLNQVLEKDFDVVMKRTENRPIAQGRISVSQALLYAGIMSTVGLILLAFLNQLAAFLGGLALVSYAFLYTPLKRFSTVSVFVGAFPGALPILIGFAAVDGKITLFALLVFLLQFFWQFPHFWAIGWLSFDDYQRAGFKLLPTVEGEADKGIGLQSFIYCVMLVPVVVALFMMGYTPVWVSIILMAIVLGFGYYGWRFYRDTNNKTARELMFASFVYLPLVLGTLLLAKNLM